MSSVFLTEKYIVKSIEWKGMNSYYITLRSSTGISEIVFPTNSLEGITLGDLYVGKFEALNE